MITEKIWLPLLRSIITALLVALFAASWFIPSPGWKLFFATLSGVCLVSWLAVVVPKSKSSSSTLKPSKVYPLKVSVDWNDGQAGLFSEFEIHRDQFIAWCVGASQGRSIGENHWTGSQAIFSKPEYHAFRDELINRGLIRAKGRHHAQGFELTGKGRALVSEVARRYSPTLPSNDGEPVIQRLPGVRERARARQNPNYVK